MSPAPRAYGVAPATGAIRTEPEDFLVEERLDLEPDGAGEHLADPGREAQRQHALGRAYARRFRRLWRNDVGYAGCEGSSRGSAAVVQPAARIASRSRLDAPRCARRACALRGAPPTQAEARCAFGQRVPPARARAHAVTPGRWRSGCRRSQHAVRRTISAHSATVARQSEGGARPRRGCAPATRATWLRALRGAQPICSTRCSRRGVGDGTWNRLLAGDAANLAGSGAAGSVVDALDASAHGARRPARPASDGTAVGAGEPGSTGEVRARERAIVAEHGGARAQSWKRREWSRRGDGSA